MVVGVGRRENGEDDLPWETWACTFPAMGNPACSSQFPAMRINGTLGNAAVIFAENGGRDCETDGFSLVGKWVCGLPKSVRASLRWGVVSGMSGSKFLGISRS